MWGPILILIGILIIFSSAKIAERTRSGRITSFSLILFLTGLVVVAAGLSIVGVIP